MSDLFDTRGVRPMLIGRISDPFDDADSIFELKLDGERCIAYLDADTTLVNRQGVKLLGSLPEFSQLHHLAKTRCILDGELIAGIGGKEDFGPLQSRLRQSSTLKKALAQKQSPVTYVVFDILYCQDRDVTGSPLMDRKALLEDTLSQTEQVALARYVPQAGKAFYELVLQQGLEGVIAKRMDSLYYPGKRTKDWAKVKNTLEDDYVICGYSLSEYVAMLMLGQYDGQGQLIYKGRTTLGLRTDAYQRIAEATRADTWPYAAPPPEAGDANITWLKPTLVCTVSFLQRTEDGLMRQPHFRRLREDKAPNEAIVTNEIP